MGKLKKKSKSTNVLEIDQNDQHYKRYFNSIYEDEFNFNKQNASKKNSFNFQPHPNNSLKEDESNHLLNWRRLQLSRTKLKQTAKTSALFAGFAMVVLVEIQLNNDPNNPIPPNLLIVFGICTILLVSIHILALMIATCILPSVESIALLENFECASDSPHERLRFFIELAWTFSSVIGVFLFLAEVIILVWVKFWELGHPLGEPGKQAALASTIVFTPFIFVFFFFAIYFYRDFAKNKYEKSTKQIEELESIIVGLQRNDNHLNEMFYSNKGFGCSNKAKKMYKKHQQYKLNTTLSQDRPNLNLKNFYRYNNRNQDLNQNLSDYQKNEYLLNETLKQQSISVDQIDKTNYDHHFKNSNDEFKIDDLYRSRICRNNLESKVIVDNDERVRFSLDNVNFNTFNNIYNNNIKYFNRTVSKNQIECFDTTKSNPMKTNRQQSNSNSIKSINSNENSNENTDKNMIAINDQQSSNDSNKIHHLKEQDNKEIKIDNLSSSIV